MWLLLIHQLPPKPDYLRAKIARRLQRLGALTLKNTVYLLPSNDQTLEDFEWTAGEIRSGGGEANVFEARFVDGLSDGEVQNRFNDARDSEYAPLIAEARAVRRKKKPDEAAIASLRERAAEIDRIDFFGAPNGQVLHSLLIGSSGGHGEIPARLRNKIWVTRAGVHVDRIACAWLIRRFIDADAKFRFVSGRTEKPARDEIRFDMFEAEFTHDGNRCTFEVLVDHIRPSDRALRAIADIVHDIDLKEERFRRPEGHGVAALIEGITVAHREDRTRIERASGALDDLYAWFSRR